MEYIAKAEYNEETRAPTIMEAYLDASDLWEAIEKDYEIDPLSENPRIAQLKSHKEKKQQKSKEYEKNEKVKGMQVLNLMREFKMQWMKESETIKEYSDRLLTILHKMRLLGTDIPDMRIVQKILVIVPERQPQIEAQVVDQQQEEEQLFAATCFATNNNGENGKRQDLGKSLSSDLMEEVQAAISSLINVNELWHKRLGHFNHVSLLYMKKQNIVEGLPSLKDHIIRSNNGKEYISDQFNSFYKEARIEHQLTTLHSTTNGVSERKNRTIVEMARCMMHENGLRKKFWAEAANTAVFLLNRLPTKAVQEKTPFEAWYGHKPFVLNFKVFGCICFTYEPKVKRNKLDKRAEAGIFIGCHTTSKAYRVFQPYDENIDDPPVRGTSFCFLIFMKDVMLLCLEPENFTEEKKDLKWIAAMEEELNMIKENQTWELEDIYVEQHEGLTKGQKDKGTLDYGVCFNSNQEFNHHGFSDNDWGGSLDDMKSTSSYCFTFSYGVFSWTSKKQDIVSQSIAETEFIAATAAVNQALWVRKILVNLQMAQTDSTKVEILVDNQAAIAISNNSVFHEKTKHFTIKLYFLRELQSFAIGGKGGRRAKNSVSDR
ncbi:hypothetical protein CR513_05259, partial [Mucuna pruriens]